MGCDSRSLAERQLSVRTEAVFGISVPCSLGWCESYLDGGSVGGVLIDAKGDSLQWAWDGAGRSAPGSWEAFHRDRVGFEAWVDSALNSAPRLAHIGGKHFRAPGVQALEVGSTRESLFVQLLWVAVGADSVFRDTVWSSHKRPRAARVARILEKQRATGRWYK
jgi:hypothetical protein